MFVAIDTTKFAKRFNQGLSEKQWTPRDFIREAYKLGYTFDYPTLYNWYNGYHAPGSMRRMAEVATVLGKSVSWMMGEKK